MPGTVACKEPAAKDRRRYEENFSAVAVAPAAFAAGVFFDGVPSMFDKLGRIVCGIRLSNLRHELLFRRGLGEPSIVNGDIAPHFHDLNGESSVRP
jgi:hypothetical protein